MRRLPRRFYRRDPRVVAPELLNKVLVHGDRAGRIIEVEAYCGAEDPGSHAFRGRTPRNATMFGPPGLLYVYLSYGMHWCANAVCGDEEEGVAVLVRALAPLAGIEEMRVARGPARRDRELCAGPGRLCQALGITGFHDGADLVSADCGVAICDDGTPLPDAPANSRRVGLTAGADSPWRWYIPGDPNLSRGRPSLAPPAMLLSSIKPHPRRSPQAQFTSPAAAAAPARPWPPAVATRAAAAAVVVAEARARAG